MKELSKARGMSPNEIRWTLSAKCLNGTQTWNRCADLGDIWGFDSYEELCRKNPDQKCWTKEGWEKFVLDNGHLYPLARAMADVSRARWSGKTGAVYLQTGSNLTSHETKELVHEEIDEFLGFLADHRTGDFAFITLVIASGSAQTRSLKWQIMVETADVAAVQAAIHAAF